jgi:hypothetical protein
VNPPWTPLHRAEWGCVAGQSARRQPACPGNALVPGQLSPGVARALRRVCPGSAIARAVPSLAGALSLVCPGRGRVVRPGIEVPAGGFKSDRRR